MGVFADPELLNPKIHCFGKCHFCKRLFALKNDSAGKVDLSARECPHCGVFLSMDRVISSHLENMMLTASITTANKIQSLDLAFIPFLILGGLMLAMGYPLWFRILNLLLYISPLVIIVKWFKKYGTRFRFDDVEYRDAVKGMKKSLLLWLFANVLNWSLLLFQPTLIFYR